MYAVTWNGVGDTTLDQTYTLTLQRTVARTEHSDGKWLPSDESSDRPSDDRGNKGDTAMTTHELDASVVQLALPIADSNGETPWLIVTGAVTIGFILLLVAAATWVALFVEDPVRRTDAYRVLRLLLSAGGGSGLLATVVQLGASFMS